MKKGIKAAWITGILGVIGTVAGAYIGVTAGQIFEQNNIQNQIETVLGDNINVIGDSSTVTINDVNTLTESYLQLQSAYNDLQTQNNFLLDQNVQYSTQLSEAENTINQLLSQTDTEVADLRNTISTMYNVDFQNVSLIINGIESNYTNKTATINNETFYSMGFLQYLVDNQAVSSNNSKLFIGSVQSEDQMPTLLFDLEPFTAQYNFHKETNMEDNYGNIYEDVFKINTISINNSDPLGNAQEYYLNGEYSTFSFDMIFAKSAYQNMDYEIVVYGDGRQLKSYTLDRKDKAVHIDVDITGVEFLQLVGRSNKDISSYYFGITNPYLYP